MGSYQIEWDPAAKREFRSLPRQLQSRIVSKINALAANPRPSGIRKLSGEEDAYRLRVGDYRVVYRLLDRQVLIIIVRVRHRREAYRA
ncbi:MAG: type II toxin-antitoxin system RelE/ParE family toxin [Candidatus Hydrogenedentes bacterium]|nr:type II toxin-antitoxin system RelE/ParE family toxin [Candidatus Hydrogenedentota bacterium]